MGQNLPSRQSCRHDYLPRKLPTSPESTDNEARIQHIWRCTCRQLRPTCRSRRIPNKYPGCGQPIAAVHLTTSYLLLKNSIAFRRNTKDADLTKRFRNDAPYQNAMILLWHSNHAQGGKCFFRIEKESFYIMIKRKAKTKYMCILCIITTGRLVVFDITYSHNISRPT